MQLAQPLQRQPPVKNSRFLKIMLELSKFSNKDRHRLMLPYVRDSPLFRMDDSKATTTITALAALNQQSTTIPRPAAHPRFGGKPYLQCLESLENAFPALKSFLEKLTNKNDDGREVVKRHYQRKHQRGPGRCYCLRFEESSASVVKENGFGSPAALREYLEKNPAKKSREVKKHRRLFILEDMEPDYVDALGHHWVWIHWSGSIGLQRADEYLELHRLAVYTAQGLAIHVGARAIIYSAILRATNPIRSQVD